MLCRCRRGRGGRLDEGADHPSNMQWQAVEDAKKKDRLERERFKGR